MKFLQRPKWSEEQCGEFAREHGQKLMERFAALKWITGTNLISATDFQLEFTDLGRQKIIEIEELSRSFTDAALVKGQRFPLWGFYKAKWKTRHIINAMPGPLMETKEEVMLYMLAWGYTRHWKEQECALKALLIKKGYLADPQISSEKEPPEEGHKFRN